MAKIHHIANKIQIHRKSNHTIAKKLKIRIFSSNATDHSPSPAAPPVHRRGLSEVMADECISNARYIINKWNVEAGKFGRFASLFLADREEAQKFLEAAIGLQQAMKYYVKVSATSEKLVGAHELMQIAMQRLKLELYAILSVNTNNLSSDSVSGGSNDGGENRETAAAEVETAVEDLKRVAECMIACGYGKECVSIYKIVRKSIVDEIVYYLGIEGVSKAELKKLEWKLLEKRIILWLRGVKIAVENLFYREKLLCSAVFSSSEKIAEACFAAICDEAAADLFAFAENVCNCRKALSPEKIFILLDLYQVISDLSPEIELIFSDKHSAAVKSRSAAAQLKLGEKIRAMLAQFEEAIRKDRSPPPPGGGVHPLTRYVMNFLLFLGDYAAAISKILDDSAAKSGISSQSTAEISRRLSWLILVLLCKLDGKAAAYDDVALSYLYLANNLNYVVSKARSSDLGILIGEDWIRKHELKMRAYLANYERIGWGDVIAAVTPPWKDRDCLESFYLSFEEVCRRQRKWVIPDPKIREDVKKSLGKRIVSGYRGLYKRSRRGGLNVRYTPEELDNYLAGLFSERI